MDIFDLAVIGGGPAGYSAAITAATRGRRQHQPQRAD